MNCVFAPTEDGKQSCITCGRIVRSAKGSDTINAICRVGERIVKAKPPGLGDHLHYWLTRCGIYYGPITWLRRQFAQEPEIVCTPCGERQEALNQIGWTVQGLAATIISKVRGWFYNREVNNGPSTIRQDDSQAA